MEGDKLIFSTRWNNQAIESKALDKLSLFGHLNELNNSSFKECEAGSQMINDSETDRTGFQDFELVTTISVAQLPEHSRGEFRETLDAEIYENSAQYPTVVQYFVQEIPEESEIIVGLQIKKVSAENVYNVATELLQESLNSATNSLGLKNSPLIEETALSLA